MSNDRANSLASETGFFFSTLGTETHEKRFEFCKGSYETASLFPSLSLARSLSYSFLQARALVYV